MQIVPPVAWIIDRIKALPDIVSADVVCRDEVGLWHSAAVANGEGIVHYRVLQRAPDTKRRERELAALWSKSWKEEKEVQRKWHFIMRNRFLSSDSARSPRWWYTRLHAPTALWSAC